MKIPILLAYILLCFISAKAQYQNGLDHSFGNKGIVTIGAPTIAYPQQFVDGALQPDGKILALSSKELVRYNADGSVDKGFGKAGIFKDTVRDDNDTPLVWFYGYSFISVSLQVDGKIIIAGSADASYKENHVILLVRLMPNGTIDTSFGKHGVVCNNAFGRLFGGPAILQPDGKIIIYASIEDSPDKQVLVRYLPNGTIDSTFGIYGKVVNPMVAVGVRSNIALMPDGRIVTMYNNFGVARYLPNGSLDTTFNHTGMASLFSVAWGPATFGMALRPDGKIWLAGYSAFDPAPNPFIVGRLNADGSIDSSFAGTGYVNYNWTAGTYNKCLDVLLQSDGKLILGGIAGNPITGNDNFGLIRIKPDGKEDSTFGDNGRLITEIFDASIDYGAALNKLLLQADRKILGLGVSGNSTLPSSTTLATIARYNANGITAINELPHGAVSYSIYPNPTHSLLYLKNNSGQKIIQLNICDLQGRLIRQLSNPGSSIDVSDLPNASYIISIVSTGAQQYKKIISIIH